MARRVIDASCPHRVTGQYASRTYQLNQRLNELFYSMPCAVGYCLADTAGDPAIRVPETEIKYAGGDKPSDLAYAGMFGASAHTDWGSFSRFSATDQTPGSADISQTISGCTVPPRLDCLIYINSGDQIAQLTNDNYKLALHSTGS